MKQIRNLINRLRLRRAFRLARAYDWLIRKSDDPYLPYAQMNAAFETPLDLSKALVARLVSPELIDRAPDYVAQTILSMTRIRAIQTLMLAAYEPDKRRTYALPAPWRNAMRERGVRMLRIWSALAWFRLQISTWRGVLALKRQLVEHGRSGWPAPESGYALVTGAPYSGAKHGIRPEGFSFFDWLVRHPDIMPPNELIMATGPSNEAGPVSGGRLAIVDNHLPALTQQAADGFARDARELLWRAALLWLSGHSWAPFLALGALEAAYFKRMARPANRYIFTIASGLLMRPFWTYEAERRGIPSYLVYYATNLKPIAGKFPYAHFPGNQLQCWPNYLIFNEPQRKWLEPRVRGAPQITVKGPVDYSDDPSIEIDIPSRSILALDVPVQMHLWRPSHGFVDHYSTTEFAEEFFMGLAEAAERLEAVVVWKGKRHGSGPAAIGYKRCLDAIAEKVPFIALDPALSPRRLARHAGACIATPFTSAALLFEAGGGAAAYFDASGALPRESVETNGLPLLQDRDQLTAWLEKALCNPSGTEMLNARSHAIR